MSVSDHQISRISVIGLGYIGLPTAALFASRKIEVVGVDINQAAVALINEGKIHIVEPELDIIIRSVVSEGYLRATLVPEPADGFIIAVPTPFKNNHEPDLSYVEAAANSIAPVLKRGDLVILESTSPVGTTEQLSHWMALARPDLTFPQTHGSLSDIRIAYCPERVLPGKILHELVSNDRVIGGMTKRCSELACALYKVFLESECIVTDTRTAEMCKLTENSFRDVNIAFANELSIICDKLNINVWELIRLANRHPRVNILQPGPGVGGHCIAVDPWFIVNSAPEEAKLIAIARQVNDSKPLWIVEKIKQSIAEYLHENQEKTSKDVTIACFGLTFKPDIDDLRESPALAIVEHLMVIHKGPILVVEPHITKLPAHLSEIISLANHELVLKEANIIVMLVNHKVFHGLPKLVDEHFKIIDVRGK